MSNLFEHADIATFDVLDELPQYFLANYFMLIVRFGNIFQKLNIVLQYKYINVLLLKLVD